MRCAIWYHLYNLNNVKNTYGGVLLLVKLREIPIDSIIIIIINIIMCSLQLSM